MRKSINEVFTPRRDEVNQSMYVVRKELENSLIRNLLGSKHTMLFGESGNGKSWLYKEVLKNNSINHIIANCAHARELGSLKEEIFQSTFPNGRLAQSSIESATSVSGGVLVVEAGETVTVHMDKLPEDKLITSYKEIAKRNSNINPSIIVFDNVEFLYNNEFLLREMASLIILLDDSKYAQYKVKFLIVGLPKDILEFFKRVDNCESIGNRLNEADKVGSLSVEDVEKIVRKGFVELLDIPIIQKDIKNIAEYVFNLTLGIAQHVHELCEKIAYLIKDNSWKYSEEMLSIGSDNWMKSGFRQAYTIVESLLNSIDTKVGRKNQVIYCIGRVTATSFSKSIIESILRKAFFESVIDKSLAVNQILTELSEKKNPIIRKTGVGTNYIIVDPLYLMVIRHILIVKNGKIEIRRIKF